MVQEGAGAERLQKLMAQAGIGSRRRCEEIIRAGRVTVDGVTAALGQRADPASQVILLDGVPVPRPRVVHEYWVLNKPAGVVSSARDPQGRPTVLELVPSSARLYPVGRLDLNTTGVLLLTDDGELAYRLTHPRFRVDKEYEVVVRGTLAPAELAELRTGVLLEDGWTAPVQAELAGRSGDLSVVTLLLHEGRKRQVRRMMESLGHSVVALHRRRVDGVDDSGLARGRARRLTAKEVCRLRRRVGLAAGAGREGSE
ncbi:MAG: rRNA pseudouridine synthase [Gaiellales bacterium]|nr:rRNA pseudouridine synthase [Gaiellales bacterium]